MRIAAFGFRSLPPEKGAAGADKFALELFPRLVARGHKVVAYNRRYHDSFVDVKEYKGVTIRTFKTIKKAGFDTLLHSCKCAFDIIINNTADIVHIQNGGNSIWALPLRLFGKKVFISQDGVDWKRDKWVWYAKLYLKFSSFITAHFPNQVIFDNVIAKRLFEEKFKKQYTFIPFGSEVAYPQNSEAVLQKYGLLKGEYYLFVGRFIPDKGLHYLIPAFKKSVSNKKLILIGGSPNPSDYETKILGMADDRVIFPGFVYGDEVNALMVNAYCYIQPSDVEGLSPVVLTVMGLNVPLIVSDIEENQYAVRDTAKMFKKGNIESLAEEINYCEQNYPDMLRLAEKAQTRALTQFNWEKVADEHIEVFKNN
ncbi:glycosyltransferase [Mucilaginibacter auburnensis]|uniref:Glycosyltransferase involved in cell wall biosynthesis n=1 Tax=Mucilaginibacter auburnensis TaxID=1457233 RepID=A0A2H9VTC8_9SPHI|nr:glycosyltransferase [Mucilaginibacter auburnensis]PJJ84076.1 glycosyltransferase involved in cell wall biosynthesis [Mucilaginibacter auburnensis]